jgi:hypothetical protein
MTTKQFDVALSFAGEDRSYVEMVAEQLKARGITVFYDKYETADLWGKDLFVHLTAIYRDKAQFMVMFVSEHYRAKLWTNHERKAAQARAFRDEGDYILPARFDDTEIPGLLETTGFIDLRQYSPAQVAILMAKKLGRNPLEDKASAIPSPKSPAISGRFAFDYRKFDGRFRVGDGVSEFETKWSNGSSTTIHCYNDQGSVRAVDLAPIGTAIQSITSADTFEFTSRAVSPTIGQIVILQNVNGLYAAARVDAVVAPDITPTSKSELRITYWILPDGTCDFSDVTEPSAPVA